jgi:hypothetical protein
MPARQPVLRRVRSALLLLLILAVAAVLLHGCPAYRDGMSGQLAQAQQESQSAVKTGVLALDLWRQHRSTKQAAAVAISDARDEVTKAYKGIATLTAKHEFDLRMQRDLTSAMTEAVNTLNTAGSAVRGGLVDIGAVRQGLIGAADHLAGIGGGG